MPERSRKNGGGHGKPGKHGKKSMRNSLRFVRKQAANMRSLISMMSGRKMAIGTKHQKSHKPHHFSTIKPAMTVNQLNNIFKALPAQLTKVRKTKKNVSMATRRSARLLQK